MARHPGKHATARALERYGIRLTKTVLARVLKDIHEGRSVMCERQSGTRSVHAVMMRDAIVPVVYDKSSKNVVTVLPSDTLREYGIVLIQ